MLETWLISTPHVIYDPPSDMDKPLINISNINLTNLLFFIAISLIVSLLVRELSCWYFKINDIKSILEDIKKNTQPTNEKRDKGSEEKKSEIKS